LKIKILVVNLFRAFLKILTFFIFGSQQKIIKNSKNVSNKVLSIADNPSFEVTHVLPKTRFAGKLLLPRIIKIFESLLFSN